MLSLSRKINETIRIGQDVTVTIRHIHGRRVRLTVEAPRHVPVMRGELPTCLPQLDHPVGPLPLVAWKLYSLLCREGPLTDDVAAGLLELPKSRAIAARRWLRGLGMVKGQFITTVRTGKKQWAWTAHNHPRRRSVASVRQPTDGESTDSPAGRSDRSTPN